MNLNRTATVKTFLSLSVLLLQIVGVTAVANPYPDETKVPKDKDYAQSEALKPPRHAVQIENHSERGLEVLRVGVGIDLANSTNAKSEKYTLVRALRELTGTASFAKKARVEPKLGSYIGVIRSKATGAALAYDSIGTGREYRKLADEISLRFPMPSEDVTLELTAENPASGKMEKVLSQEVTLTALKDSNPDASTVEIRELNRLPFATGGEIRFNIYAEGYLSDRRDAFFEDAARAVQTLKRNNFPMVDKMHFYAVFGPSKEILGAHDELSLPRQSRDTFLNLYFPYWDQFGRWYDVVYPAKEEVFRRQVGVAPYDYILVLVDDSTYWGIGNFRVFTAVPAHHSSFTYLLLHEMGHYFGLNEEYEGGGRTELEFAPGIAEPWSQNNTFDPLHLKWASFVSAQTPLPTPESYWDSRTRPYGAYKGGYADSEPLHQSHKPGLACVMEAHGNFCDICRSAIEKVVRFDLGEN